MLSIAQPTPSAAQLSCLSLHRFECHCNRLAPLYPDKLMLGMEIRDKVAAYVCERIGEHILSLLQDSSFSQVCHKQQLSGQH